MAFHGCHEVPPIRVFEIIEYFFKKISKLAAGAPTCTWTFKTRRAADVHVDGALSHACACVCTARKRHATVTLLPPRGSDTAAPARTRLLGGELARRCVGRQLQC